MYFFKTLKEKLFVLKQLKRGNIIPFCKYLVFRFGFGKYFFIRRKWYRMRVWFIPYAFWLWNHEDVEKEEEIFFERFLREGDVVIDGGAHLGTLSIIASKKVGQSGAVYAFEAHPRTFSFLEKNIKDNNCTNITVIPKALSNTKKKTTISNFYAADLNTIEEGEVSTETITLDEVKFGDKRIALLKLDVEGQELQALQGAKSLLQKVDAIYFESAPISFSRFNYSLKDILLFLEENGFKVFKEEKGVLKEIEKNHETKVRYENMLALKNLDIYKKRLSL
jgi:FkbM family methyltransferase